MAVVVTLNAKHEGTFTVENIEKSGDFFEIDTLTVKYSVGFLMGEMVLDANAKYSLGNYITVDGTIHRMNEFPDEVKNELKLTELKVQVGVVSGLALPNMNVSIDLGAMGKPNTWSYNTSSSPNWDKFIYSGIHEVPMYFDKEKTIKVMKEFKRFGLGEHLSGARTGSIGYDVSAVRDFLIKQKKDKAKSAEEKLKKAEEQLKETKGKKQKTAIEDIVKSKEQVITAKKDLLAELERKENAEYKRRIEKENKDALNALFASLEKMEKENYNERIKKKQVVRTIEVTSSKKSFSSNNQDNNLGNYKKWVRVKDNSGSGGILTISNKSITIQYYYNKKPSGKYEGIVIEIIDKNHWIVEGGAKSSGAYRNRKVNKSKIHLVYTKENYLLMLPFGVDMSNYSSVGKGNYTKDGHSQYWKYEFKPF